MILKNREYHPVAGLMPSPLEEVPEELGWYKEKWATPYMAAVAREVFGGGFGPTMLSHLHLGLFEPDVTLTPQVGAEKIIEGATALGAAPEFGEWFKKNRILVVAIIVALVLLFFFLRKGRR